MHSADALSCLPTSHTSNGQKRQAVLLERELSLLSYQKLRIVPETSGILFSLGALCKDASEGWSGDNHSHFLSIFLHARVVLDILHRFFVQLLQLSCEVKCVITFPMKSSRSATDELISAKFLDQCLEHYECQASVC